MDDLNGTPRPEFSGIHQARSHTGDAVGTGRRERPEPWLYMTLLVALAGLAGALGAWLWRRRLAKRPAPPPPPIRVEGLTEEEAEARRLEGQDNVIEVKPRRTRQQIWRENVYNIFNLNLVGLAAAQLLLGRPLDALLSIGTIVLNIGINLFQEMFTRRRLSEVELATRPKATVIRSKRVRSIDPSEIVLGDALIIGPGDQVLADGELIGEGQIVVNESLVTGRCGWRPKATGDQVLAGSFCLSGRAACRVGAVGDQRQIAARMDEAAEGKEELTPLQRVVDQILRGLIVLVAVMTVLVLVQYFRLDMGVGSDLVNEIISIIFNVAPSSLFLMIIVTYATGTADLGRLRALVYRARSVESLAQATVICFAKAGIVTGTVVEIGLSETVDEEDTEESGEPPGSQPALAESRIRQILGDYARTTSVDNLAIRGLADTFEGSSRVAREEAPFLSVYGWNAITFDDEDLRGVYVLAEKDVLEEHIAMHGEAGADAGGGAMKTVRNAVAPVGRMFGRVRGLLPGGTDIERVRSLIIDTVRQIEGVLHDKPVDALYVEMGDSAMVFRVRWWIESYVDTRCMFDRVHTALQNALDEAGIECPFPTQTRNLQFDSQVVEQITRALGTDAGPEAG